MRAFPHSSHSCLGRSAETFRVRHWFEAAAVCRVCEFVAVEVSVGSFRFDVVSGVAVVASEEHAVSLIVSCVCLVARSTMSKVLRAISIRGGSTSIFLLMPLLSWNPLSLSAGDISLSWSLRK